MKWVQFYLAGKCIQDIDPGPYLLEVGSKAVHVLVIGQQGVRLTAIAVDVPHPQHGQQHWQVLLQGSSVEVIILHHTKESYTSDKATAIPPNSYIVFIVVLMQWELPTNCHFNIIDEDTGSWTLEINLPPISLLTALREEEIWNGHPTLTIQWAPASRLSKLSNPNNGKKSVCIYYYNSSLIFHIETTVKQFWFLVSRKARLPTTHQT